MNGPVLKGYTLIEVLGGRGGETLYRARQHSLDREVVVHLWELPGDGEALQGATRAYERLRRLAALNQPHIVRIHDMGRYGSNGYFYVREYVDGEGLSARLARKGALREQEALMLAENVAHALREARDIAGVGHVELRPGSVLISSSGLVKLSGFVHPHRPAAAEIHTDMRALGALLETMVTGAAGLHAQDEIKGCCSASCVSLIEKLRASDGTRGFASWDALIDELDSACEAAIPKDAPVSTGAASCPSDRRRRALLLVFGVLVAASLIYYGWPYLRSDNGAPLLSGEHSPDPAPPVVSGPQEAEPAPDGERVGPGELLSAENQDAAVEEQGVPEPETEIEAATGPAPGLPEWPAAHTLDPDHALAPQVAYGRLIKDLTTYTRAGHMEEAFNVLDDAEAGRRPPGVDHEVLAEDRRALERVAALRSLMAHGAERLAGMVLRADPERPWVLSAVEESVLVLTIERDGQQETRRVPFFEMGALEWVLLMNRIDPRRLFEHQAVWRLACGDVSGAVEALERAENLGEDLAFERAWLERWQQALRNAEADRLLVALLETLEAGGAEARRLINTLQRRYADSAVVLQSSDLLDLLRLYGDRIPELEHEPRGVR